MTNERRERFEVVLQVTYDVEAKDTDEARELARRKVSGMRVKEARAVHEEVIDVRQPGGESLIHGPEKEQQA